MKKSLKKRPRTAVREFLLAHISEHPRDLVGVTAKHFRISAVAVQKHLKQLVKDGRVKKIGQTRATIWKLGPSSSFEKQLKITKGLEEYQVWLHDVKPNLPIPISDNVEQILAYGFTEMFNNVIDHSEGTLSDIRLESQGLVIKLAIRDNGIGIFRKLQKAFNLQSPRESILELVKGKVTTDKKNHSGEGIFFTSRAVDRFQIRSRGLVYIKDNILDDWLVDTMEKEDVDGSEIVLEISKDSQTSLKAVFAAFTHSETLRFNKTHIVVELAKQGDTDYISRSQAKRILVGLEKFEHVVMDFRNIRTVGQAFVDEVFRVFQESHPGVNFECIHMNENVEFMVKRGLQART